MIKYGPAGWLFPKPVMIIGTYDKECRPNAMNADCGGSWDHTEISLFLGKHRQTTLNLQETREFTLALPNKDTMIAADFVGITSGLRMQNKMEKSGLTAHEAPDVKAPVFSEFPITLECRVKEVLDDATSRDCYHLIAEIVGVLVDDKFVASDGYPDIQKMKLICHETIHQTYIELGETAGKAFRVGTKLK